MTSRYVAVCSLSMSGSEDTLSSVLYVCSTLGALAKADHMQRTTCVWLGAVVCMYVGQADRTSHSVCVCVCVYVLVCAVCRVSISVVCVHIMCVSVYCSICPV